MRANQIVVLAVFDSAINAYMQPIFAPTIPAAVRMFTDAVMRPGDDNGFNRHPEDYSLWYLGYFDTEQGTFELDSDGRRVVLRAKDVTSYQQAKGN